MKSSQNSYAKVGNFRRVNTDELCVDGTSASHAINLQKYSKPISSHRRHEGGTQLSAKRLICGGMPIQGEHHSRYPNRSGHFNAISFRTCERQRPERRRIPPNVAADARALLG